MNDTKLTAKNRLILGIIARCNNERKGAGPMAGPYKPAAGIDGWLANRPTDTARRSLHACSPWVAIATAPMLQGRTTIPLIHAIHTLPLG